MAVFWHCGLPYFSSKTLTEARFRQPTVNGFDRESGSKGSGNADSQRFVRSSGRSGHGRPYLRDSGCVRAHPDYWRASASYRPLRAVWAVCAWALRGYARSKNPSRARTGSAPATRKSAMTNVTKSDKDRVIIFDTTLRDGEQCPGATMTFEEKIEIAEMLDDMGCLLYTSPSPRDRQKSRM